MPGLGCLGWRDYGIAECEIPFVGRRMDCNGGFDWVGGGRLYSRCLECFSTAFLGNVLVVKGVPVYLPPSFATSLPLTSSASSEFLKQSSFDVQ